MGETTGEPSGPRRLVSATIRPVARSTRNSSESPGSRSTSSRRSLDTTTERPSGIQAGVPLMSYGPSVTLRGVPPSAGTTNSWLLPGRM